MRFVTLVCVTLLLFSCALSQQYQPNWDSLDQRPLPEWYDNAKIGIFIHWGVFSVPSFVSEWFWWYWQGSKSPDVVEFMQRNYPPDWTYADFAPQFTAEFYDPDFWADLFKASGAKYVVLTTKHHEGFCNWPSKHSFNWNSMEVGPKRDLVGEFAKSIRNRTDLKFGLYHSLFEWFNPLNKQDAANNFTTQDFVKSKTMPELYELVENYRPDVIWSDGDAGPDYYWNSTQFLAWLYNESPVRDSVVTNDRWGSNGIACTHGGFFTCDDRYNPGKLQNHKWENCFTIDKKSWGYRRNANISEMLTIEEIIATVAETVSCGGNVLINVGPTKEGIIVPIFQERLLQLGEWLSINGEAIYETQPWKYQNDTTNSNVWYTMKNDSVYAILLRWPKDSFVITAPKATKNTEISLLGYEFDITWSKISQGIKIDVTNVNKPQKSKWAWVFKLTNIG